MKQFAPGQRWMSQAEPELGIGTLIEITRRRLSLSFESSRCVREYTLESAPLKRVRFKPDDTITLRDGTRLKVDEVLESDGLLVYGSGELLIPESDLSDTISVSLPGDRLMAGFHDPNDVFNLRFRTRDRIGRYHESPVRGFLGGQIDLIPHQFYIAQEVCSRLVPRVLLSDETGLGKTIEACLILHHLMICERINRVLVIVPESLVHQWFVELYRKFKFTFRLFNDAFIRDTLLSAYDANPFLEDQAGIISREDLLKDQKLRHMVLEAGWDMVVIDEIHHINHHHNSYTFFQELSQSTLGLLLLSATPEQMGLENHFSHLRLIDPERYYDFDAYTREMTGYQALAAEIKSLEKNKAPFDHILDRYGPGRVVFKNTRKVVKGFPKREAVLYHLDTSNTRARAVNQEFESDQIPGSGADMFHEKGSEHRSHGFDFTDDPRIHLLLELLTRYPDDKFLLICTSHQKAVGIKSSLEALININIAGFDETMSLMQRDRNAAWFSKPEGARLLICSEIGSEGRNFQFSRHLFLFDLPLNPELLEQRIGRLDRIGQKNDIFIHVPCLNNTAYALLAQWYMDGLNLFNTNINGLHQIYIRFREDLDHLLSQIVTTHDQDSMKTEKLIRESKEFCSRMRTMLKKGRNILLELNSFKPEPARALIGQIREADRDETLQTLFCDILDVYDIDHDLSPNQKLRFRVHEQVEEGFPIPGPPDRPHIATFKRKTAISREDLDFFNLDHPYIQKVFDFFIQTGKGNCALGRLKTPNAPGLLLDAVFILESIVPAALQVQRFLPPLPIRVILDHETRDVAKDYPFEWLDAMVENDSSQWLQDLPVVRQEVLPGLLDAAESVAKIQADQIINNAGQNVDDVMGREISRLASLSRVNPGIKPEEIDHARIVVARIHEAIDSARIRMDALRLIRLE
ncbi:MAG: RNA polymerase-binding ATPase [Desulfobacteraceae bacterium]|nr:MAG: RNA polymerase-binding ATPase [Desulfobacteraceae bacterium]